MAIDLTDVVPMSAHQVLIGFRWKPCCKGLLTLVMGVSLSAWAQPRLTPAPDQIVLPASVHAQNNQAGSLREVEREWRKNRNDLPASLNYARAVFLLGLTEGDLRWYGSAKAALQPWWGAATLPADGHFLRALVKQGFHDFKGGIEDLSAAIAIDPTQPEYWSWRFSLNLLTANMPAARADCDAIGQRFGRDEGQACAATLMYRTGQAQQAIPLLNRLVDLPDYQGPFTQDWLRYHQGEAYRTAGQYEQAIAVWEKHVQARPNSHLVKLTLTELLNQQGQFAKARRYANTDSPTDALLVQALLASRGLKDGDTQRLADLFENRMNNQSLRGESLIERPTMVYLITYGRDNAKGLELAADNWSTQNEPADAVLLVQAALKANQPRRAEPVLAWMKSTGYTDPVLKALAEELQTRLGKS
jgi:tetratricopeptide (TPR) repeat protein